VEYPLDDSLFEEYFEEEINEREYVFEQDIFIFYQNEASIWRILNHGRFLNNQGIEYSWRFECFSDRFDWFTKYYDTELKERERERVKSENPNLLKE